MLVLFYVGFLFLSSLFPVLVDFELSEVEKRQTLITFPCVFEKVQTLLWSLKIKVWKKNIIKYML